MMIKQAVDGGGELGSLGFSVARQKVRSRHHGQVDPIAGLVMGFCGLATMRRGKAVGV